MKGIKKMVFIYILLGVFLLGFLLWFFFIGTPALLHFFALWGDGYFDEDYFEILGFEYDLSYFEITRIYGEPLEITYEKRVFDVGYNAIVIYEGIEFMIAAREKNMDENNSWFKVFITDPAIRFERRTIGIGSTRAEVERKFKKVPRTRRTADIDLGYHKRDVYINFEMTEDVVSGITVGWAG